MFAFLYALLMATVVASVVYFLTRQVYLARARHFLTFVKVVRETTVSLPFLRNSQAPEALV